MGQAGRPLLCLTERLLEFAGPRSLRRTRCFSDRRSLGALQPTQQATEKQSEGESNSDGEKQLVPAALLAEIVTPGAVDSGCP